MFMKPYPFLIYKHNFNITVLAEWLDIEIIWIGRLLVIQKKDVLGFLVGYMNFWNIFVSSRQSKEQNCYRVWYKIRQLTSDVSVSILIKK